MRLQGCPYNKKNLEVNLCENDISNVVSSLAMNDGDIATTHAKV